MQAGAGCPKQELDQGRLPCFARPWPAPVAGAAAPSTHAHATIVTGTWSLGASQRPLPPHCCPAEDVDPLGRAAPDWGCQLSRDRARPHGKGHAGRKGATAGRYAFAPQGLCSSSHQTIEGQAAGVTGTAPCEPHVPLSRAAAHSGPQLMAPLGGRAGGEQERPSAILEAFQKVPRVLRLYPPPCCGEQ